MLIFKRKFYSPRGRRRTHNLALKGDTCYSGWYLFGVVPIVIKRVVV